MTHTYTSRHQGFGSKFDVRLRGTLDLSARARRNSRRKSQNDAKAAANAANGGGGGGGADAQRDSHRWSGGAGVGLRAVSDEEVLAGLWRDMCLRISYDAIYAGTCPSACVWTCGGDTGYAAVAIWGLS